MSATFRALPEAPWMEHGECRGCDPELFFPEQGGPNNGEDAKRICNTCPVKTPCYEYGTTYRLVGVWGGTTGQDRRRIRRKRRESAGARPSS